MIIHNRICPFNMKNLNNCLLFDVFKATRMIINDKFIIKFFLSFFLTFFYYIFNVLHLLLNSTLSQKIQILKLKGKFLIFLFILTNFVRFNFKLKNFAKLLILFKKFKEIIQCFEYI